MDYDQPDEPDFFIKPPYIARQSGSTDPVSNVDGRIQLGRDGRLGVEAADSDNSTLEDDMADVFVFVHPLVLMRRSDSSLLPRGRFGGRLHRGRR